MFHFHPVRIKGLDFLRGIAILGVLFRHCELRNIFTKAGGYGVDLFFVLSGFLVAGLLFDEYKKHGFANIKRFLIRRGFKIYPVFYIYLIISISIDLVFFKRDISAKSILSEVFFLQSYGYPIRFHTWSLAVEEHFYLLLSLLVFLAIRFKWLEQARGVLLFLAAFIILVFTMRFIHCYPYIGSPQPPIFATHLRLDGLITGVLFSYVLHFHKTFAEKFYSYRIVAGMLAVVLIAPAFLLSPGSFFMATLGFNLMHFGFGILILLLIDKNRESILFTAPILKKISEIICVIGVSSYSIYLWHLLVRDIIDAGIPAPLLVNAVVYFVGAIGIGFLSTRMVERKFLNIRNLYFPSRA